MWPFTRAKEGEDAAAAAPAPPEPTVDLLDHAAVKRALDDAFAEAFLEAGHVEDMRLFNWKFGLGTIACVVFLEGRGREGTLSLAARAPPHTHALLSLSLSSCLVALFAQFYPGKPPATVPLLAACVAAYVALSLAAGGFATWVERDAFLVTRAQQVREREKKREERRAGVFGRTACHPLLSPQAPPPRLPRLPLSPVPRPGRPAHLLHHAPLLPRLRAGAGGHGRPPPRRRDAVWRERGRDHCRCRRDLGPPPSGRPGPVPPGPGVPGPVRDRLLPDGRHPGPGGGKGGGGPGGRGDGEPAQDELKSERVFFF